MRWSRIMSGVTVAAYLYLPLLRCLDCVEAANDPISFSVMGEVAKLGPLALMLIAIGWRQSWAACAGHSVGMAACAVFLNWLLERVGMASSNQPIDSRSWWLYEAVFTTAFAVPLLFTRGVRWIVARRTRAASERLPTSPS
jgi:hypothetical protein